MLVNDRTIYRVCVFLPDSELEEIEHCGGDWIDAVLGKIIGAGWRGALRKDERAEDEEGSEGIGITFEVQTPEERDRLLGWLETNPIKP